MYYVYVIKSLVHNTRYVGSANKIEKRISYCIEYDKNRIIQARGFANSNMNSELKEILSNIIFNKEELKKAI